MVENLLQMTARFERTGQKVQEHQASWPVFPRQDTILVAGTISGSDLTALSVKGTLKIFDTELNQLVLIATKTAVLTLINDNIQRYQIAIAEPEDTEAFEMPATYHFDIQASTTPTILGTVPMVRTILGGFKMLEDYTIVAP